MTSIYLKTNCGYSRVAIRMLSDLGPGMQHSQVDKHRRATQFQELFGDTSDLKSEYFEAKQSRQSLFDRHCNEILTLGKIKSKEKRQQYLKTFAIKAWKSLSSCTKTKHTLASCIECALAHTELQQAFPGPKYQTTEGFTHEIKSLSATVSASRMTRHVLSELQEVYKTNYGTSFTKAVCQCRGCGLQ